MLRSVIQSYESASERWREIPADLVQAHIEYPLKRIDRDLAKSIAVIKGYHVFDIVEFIDTFAETLFEDKPDKFIVVINRSIEVLKCIAHRNIPPEDR